MIEYTIHATGEIEWNVLIATTIVYTLSVLVLKLEGLSAEVHLAEPLSSTNEALVGFALETDCCTLISRFCRDIA